MNKTELLTRTREANDKLEQVFAALTEEQIERAGVYDDLSAKDVLAHLAAWQQLETNWLRDSLLGRSAVRYAPGFEVSLATPESEVQVITNRLNDFVFRQNKLRPFADVLKEYRRTFRQLNETIEQMSEEDLNDPERFDWWRGEPVWVSIAGNSYEHVNEHVGLIHAWLESQAG